MNVTRIEVYFVGRCHRREQPGAETNKARIAINPQLQFRERVFQSSRTVFASVVPAEEVGSPSFNIEAAELPPASMTMMPKSTIV
jgi:hypothetical protein